MGAISWARSGGDLRAHEIDHILCIVYNPPFLADPPAQYRNIGATPN